MSDTRQKIEKEIADLFNDVLEYRDSERFKELLSFCVKLNTLGSYNAMLVKMQCPGAKYVLSRQKWAEYNRRLIPNARPLMILAPFGPVSFVFDISETDPMQDMPLYEDDFFEELGDPFKAKGYVDIEEYKKLLSNLKFCGVEEKEVFHYSNETIAHIEVSHSEPIIDIIRWRSKIPIRFSLDYLLTINAKLPYETQLVGIVHELAHIFCEHIAPPLGTKEPLWEVRRLSKLQQQFEAETVAWLITRRHGIEDSKSVEYLSKYLDNDGKIPVVSVSHIMSAVDKIEPLFETVEIKKSWLYKNVEDFKQFVDEKLGHPKGAGSIGKPRF